MDIGKMLLSLFPQRLNNAGHLVGDAYLLWTLRQTFLAVLTTVRPRLLVSQCLAITLSELLLPAGIVTGRTFGQGGI